MGCRHRRSLLPSGDEPGPATRDSKPTAEASNCGMHCRGRVHPRGRRGLMPAVQPWTEGLEPLAAGAAAALAAADAPAAAEPAAAMPAAAKSAVTFSSSAAAVAAAADPSAAVSACRRRRLSTAYCTASRDSVYLRVFTVLVGFWNGVKHSFLGMSVTMACSFGLEAHGNMDFHTSDVRPAGGFCDKIFFYS